MNALTTTAGKEWARRFDQATLYDGMSSVGEGNAATPALALCAAALRARAAQEAR